MRARCRAKGGQGWTVLEQVLVHGSLAGRSPVAYVPGAYRAGPRDQEQRERYLDPSSVASDPQLASREAAGSDDARSRRPQTWKTPTGDSS